MTITGTCYFPSVKDAVAYYYNELKIRFPKYEKNVLAPHPEIINQNITIAAECVESVNEKIESGAIYIGRPPLKSGQTLFIQDNRYFIQEG